MHQLKDSLSPKRILEVGLTNKSDEVLAYFPELRKPLDQIRERMDVLAQIIEQAYEGNKNLPNQKTFELAIKDLPYSGVLFNLHASKIKTVQEGLRQVHLDKIAGWLRLEEFGELLF